MYNNNGKKVRHGIEIYLNSFCNTIEMIFESKLKEIERDDSEVKST